MGDKIMNMLPKLKLLLLGTFSMLTLTLALPMAAAVADCTNPTTTVEAIQCGTDNTAGVPQGSDPGTTLEDTITQAVNIISLVVGIAAVIMIIVGGFRYITSAGNQERVKAAKNTLVYAIIGLVIVALAQVIVRFVLTQTTTNSSTVGQCIQIGPEKKNSVTGKPC